HLVEGCVFQRFQCLFFECVTLVIPNVTGRAHGMIGCTVRIGEMAPVNYTNRAMINACTWRTDELALLVIQGFHVAVCHITPGPFHIGHESCLKDSGTIVKPAHVDRAMIVSKFHIELNVQERVAWDLSRKRQLKVVPLFDLYAHLILLLTSSIRAKWNS